VFESNRLQSIHEDEFLRVVKFLRMEHIQAINYFMEYDWCIDVLKLYG
jgi:hypothetical protein